MTLLVSFPVEPDQTLSFTAFFPSILHLISGTHPYSTRSHRHLRSSLFSAIWFGTESWDDLELRFACDLFVAWFFEFCSWILVPWENRGLQVFGPVLGCVFFGFLGVF